MLVLHIIKQKLFSSGIHYKSAGRMSLFNSLYFDTYANVTVQCFRISVSFYFRKLFMCDINTHLHRWMSTLPECLSNWCLIIQISLSFSPTTKTLRKIHRSDMCSAKLGLTPIALIENVFTDIHLWLEK